MQLKACAILCILLVLLPVIGDCHERDPVFSPHSPEDPMQSTLIAANAGELTTEGDILVRSNGIREVFGVAGRNIRVGVIGNGVESLNLSRQTGELSDVLVLSPGTGDEGTAMMEIIHDIAPEADLVFHAYGNSSDTFKQAVTALAENGCNVICDDLYFFRQPFFEDGDVADHIRKTLGQYPGLIYVTVSGNFAPLHYQGSWSGANHTPDGSMLHDFRGGDNAINITLLPDEYIIATLQWDDPWGLSFTDYDMVLTSSVSGTVLATSTYIQNGTGDPFEHLVYMPEGREPEKVSLLIFRKGSTDSPNILELFIRGVDPDGVEDACMKQPRDSIFGHAALEEVITVGSVEPAPPFSISPDSSQGPVTIRFPTETRRWKPDICAPTNVNVSGAGNFPSPFPGTSAAAPHVAGVIAQLWSAFPAMNREDLKRTITGTADDLGTPGWDETYGYGLLNAERAYRVLYELNRNTSSSQIP